MFHLVSAYCGVLSSLIRYQGMKNLSFPLQTIRFWADYKGRSIRQGRLMAVPECKRE